MSERCNVRKTRLAVGVFEDEEGHEPRNAGGLQKGKGKERASPLDLAEGTQPCQYLDF